MNDSDRHDELAERIGDGQPVDWKQVTDSGKLDPALVRQLEALSKISDATLRAEDSDFRVHLKGRYRLVDRLGAGGMGEVYVALREHLGDLVAIKMLPPTFSADREARERLKKEAKILAQIKHPNVAQIYDLDEHEGRDFIVMELVHGETLRQRLEKEGALGEEQAIKLVLQLLSGLGEAHANRVVHRDLKPENLIITPEGDLKILDFGIAKELPPDSADPQSMDTIAGTAPYMAPEQILGAKVRATTDLYTVGVILAELVTGSRPYREDTAHALVSEILSGQPVPLRERNGELSLELEASVRRLLEKESDKRHASATELAEDLRKILKIRFTESEVVEIERSGGGKVRLAVLGALLITVLALSIYSFWPSASEDLGIDPTAIAVFPFSIRGDESIQYLGEGMVDLLYASLDGAGEFRSISPARVIGALAERTDPLDPESAAVLARQLRAGLYILGSIVRVGEELRITATLHGENGTTEQTALAVAAGEAELPRSIDSVASDLLRGRIGKADLPPGIDTNLPALRAFLDGQRSMRNGDWDKAVEDYLRAVVADSNFAYGYARMSMAAGYPHDTERQLYACEKALALRDQLSDHMADLVQINQQFLYELSDEPTARLRKLVARYPDDSVAWYMLADYGAHCGPLLGYPRTEAVVAMNRAFEAGIGDDDYGLLFHQRVLTAAVGDMDAYDRTLKQLEELNPDGDLSAWARLEAALLHRDTAARREAMSDLALAPVNSIIGAANTMMGGLVEGVTNLGAAREIGSILQSPERTAPVQCLGSIIDAYADAAEGRISLALKKLREARAVDVDYAIAFESYVALAAFLPEGVGMDPRVLRGELLAWAPEPAPADWTLDSNPVSDPHRGLHGDLRLYLLGLSGARAGDVTAAELYAGSLAENGSIGPTRVLADGIRAELMFGSGLAVEAIPMLEPPNLKFNWIFTHFSPFLARTRERFLLAEALREAGELDQALVWYNLASMQSTLDVLYRAPCHLRRGEIHEELGNDEDALRHYRRFVELWAECDPELRPRVDEARMAIARLES